jgi:Sulfotransferase domain
MMAERGDFTMVHEPFSYLAEFGQADIAGERVTSAAGLISVLTSLGRDGRVFAKETTGRRYPEVLADQQFLASGARHAFLIRRPRETIASYRALDPGAGLHKIGFESQYEIFAEICRLTGRAPAVIDTEDLVTRPAAIIGAYCAQAGIDFRPGALTWQPSDLPQWQPSRRWHADAAASTGFACTAARPVTDPGQDPVLSRYLRYHLPFYEKLHTRRLTA